MLGPYLCDALQSVVNLTNDQGNIQARYQYDAWGIRTNQVGTSYNRFSFTGYEEDKETGLLYAKARFYDPDTGKFLSEDAWEGDNMIAPSLHRYLYGYQNPTVFVDRTGNAPIAADMVNQLNSKADAYSQFALEQRQMGNHRNATGASVISGANRAVGALMGVVNAAADLVISTNVIMHEVKSGYQIPEHGMVADSRANLDKVGQGISTAASTVANFHKREVRAKLGTPLVETAIGVANNDPESLNKLAAGSAGAIVGSGVTSKVLPTREKGGGNSELVEESTSSPVVNPLPDDRTFARVMPRKYAEAFARGEGNLGGGEVWITAADDLKGVTTRSQAQERLSLYSDFDASVPNKSGDTVVEFKLNDVNGNSISTPIETGNTSPAGPVQPRGYGFEQGGQTAGGAREWLIDNGTKTEVNASEITLRELDDE